MIPETSATQTNAKKVPYYSTRLQGKTALITGGGTGIGKAIVKEFVRQGARVVVCGRRKEKLEEAVQAAGGNGQAIAVQADVTKKEDAQRMIGETLERFKKIDCLINNAGIFKGDRETHKFPDKDWEHVLNVNLNSVFRLTRACIPHMIQGGGGCIINIASILGLIAIPNAAAYNASKGGVIQFTKSLAVEYGKNKIRANAIAPGLVKTPMTEDFMANQPLMDELIKGYPIGFFGAPEDIAHAAVYLTSDEARWVTGVILPVDGGYTAQ